jgi:UDP-glucose 4-epimerase
VFGDGKDSMDFVYVGDVARANLLAAASDASDEVCNIASGVETDLVTLAHTLLEVMGSDLAIEYGPARSLTRVARRVSDTTKAKELIGFQAEVPLAEGLARLVAWWQEAKLGAGEPQSTAGAR